MQKGLAEDDGDSAEDRGEGESGLDSSAKVIEAEYWAPYLAHATMEPMNCTIWRQGDTCEVWTGNQGPQLVQALVAQFAGLDQDKIKVNTPFLGGGFGRRGLMDYVAEAGAIAKEVEYPVQLVWSREDDTRHGYYRPPSLVKFKAGIDEKGDLQTWCVKRAGPNIMPYLLDDVVDALLPSAIQTAWQIGSVSAVMAFLMVGLLIPRVWKVSMKTMMCRI